MASGRRSPEVIDVARDEGSIALRLDEPEAALLRRLNRELRALLESSASAPNDPVSKRLFPDAYDDSEDARSYRDLVGAELLSAKLGALERMGSLLGDEGEVAAQLSAEDAEAWLTALTDMRLAIGTRLEVDEETMNADIDPEHESFSPLWVLHWLGWVQESILREEMRR